LAPAERCAAQALPDTSCVSTAHWTTSTTLANSGTIAGELDDAAAMLGNFGFDEVLA
jgi:hypothetical protein